MTHPNNVHYLHRGVPELRPSVISQIHGEPAEMTDLYRAIEQRQRMDAVLADEARDARWFAVRPCDDDEGITELGLGGALVMGLVMMFIGFALAMGGL